MTNVVPFTLRSPVLVLTFDELVNKTPHAEPVPHAAVPVIVTWPAPVAEMLAELKATPLDVLPVPHEVPLTVSEPKLVVTQAPEASMP